MKAIELEVIQFTVADVIATSIQIPIEGDDNHDSRV